MISCTQHEMYNTQLVRAVDLESNAMFSIIANQIIIHPNLRRQRMYDAVREHEHECRECYCDVSHGNRNRAKMMDNWSIEDSE